MEKPQIRPEMIGVKTSSKTLSGMVTVTEDHAEMFLREGRFDLIKLPGEKELRQVNVDKVKPKKKSAKENDTTKSE